MIAGHSFKSDLDVYVMVATRVITQKELLYAQTTLLIISCANAKSAAVKVSGKQVLSDCRLHYPAAFVLP